VYISGLSPGTAYHFRVKAENSEGIVIGSNFLFVTLICNQGPTVTALAATNIRTDTVNRSILLPLGIDTVWVNNIKATFYGTVNANGLPTTVTFIVGQANPSGKYRLVRVIAEQSPVTGNSITEVRADISIPLYVVHSFRISATNACGTICSNSISFKQ